MRLRSSYQAHRRIRGFIGFFAIAALVFPVAVSAYAADLTVQPVDRLNVTNSISGLLPQQQASESSWLEGLHVSGYASQTFGM